MAAPTILYDQARELLNHIINYFTTEGVPPPDRQYVAHGEPSHDFGPEMGDEDCTGQLTVSMDFLFPGQPGAETSDSLMTRGCVHIDSMEYSIEIVRCVPTMDDGGTAPSDLELDSSSLDLAIDGWLLRRAVMDAFKTGVFCTCQDVQIGRMTAITPRGGVAGWRQTVQFELTCGAAGS